MTDCIIWQGRIDRDGYGRDGRPLAYRLAWEREHGPVPAGLEIDHLCRNRACVNVGHLEIVTHRENTLRGNTVTAINARKTHCLRGHPFDEANTRRFGPELRLRRCRACERAQYARKKAAA